MTNHILHIDLEDQSLVPAEVEVLVTVVPEFIDSGTEVRGRLVGPRCQFAGTVEVAYHLRRVLLPTSRPALSFKVIIPEASLWEPETPHLYGGPVELWQDGVRCEVVPVRHGLRHLNLGPRGLRLNGRPLHLCGREVRTLGEEEALALRKEGYNLLLAPVAEESRHLWDLADRLGFLVLGRIVERDKSALTAVLARHPCCLGWLLTSEPPADLPPAALLGVEPGAPAVAQANFRTVPAGETLRDEAGLPVLQVGAARHFECPAALEGGAVVLGVVEG
jgi:hypothetical protein